MGEIRNKEVELKENIERMSSENNVLEKEIEQLESSSSEIVGNDVSEINQRTILEGLDEYFDGEEISEIKSKTIRIASVAGLAGTLGASLVGCKNNLDVYVEENVSTKVPMVETMSIPKETKTPENIINFSENKDTVYKALDLSDVEMWKELSPEKIEKVEKTIQTTEDTKIIHIPVQEDYFYNQKENPTILKLPAGSNLEIKDIYYFKGEDDNIVRFSILPNVMASKSIPVIFLDNGHMEGESYVIDGKNYEEQKAPEVLSSFSYAAGEDEVYPNKITNILASMQKIVERQEKEGKFLKGQEYSYLDLINLENPWTYKEGYTASGAVFKGGGVCAGTTLLSNSLYELGINENISWENIVKEKTPHKEMYFLGPFSVNNFVTDSTVYVSYSPKVDSLDFRWIQPKDAFIKIDISMIPNGLSMQDTELSGIGGKSDVELMVTLSFTETDPGNQSQKIADFISAYNKYRSSGHLNISPLLDQGEYVKEIDWDNPTYQVIMDYVYPEERIEHFQEDIENEEYLSQIKELQSAVNALPSDFSGNLGDYLKTTEWYEGISDKESIETSLAMVSYTRIKGQPLQCVGFAILLAGLKYEELNFQNVGGAFSFGMGTTSAKSATELTPYYLLGVREPKSGATGYGGIALGSPSMKIEDYKAGDLFVRTDIGGSRNGVFPNGEEVTFSTGHIGAIIGKKIVDGEVVLLVADSNRKNDGKIRIFEVTEANFYKIFGDPGVTKIIIRAPSK